MPSLVPATKGPPPPVAAQVRLRAVIYGRVQGVGFRPFVYRTAMQLGLAGWVSNGPRGVVLEVEGDPAAVEAFRLRLGSPPRHSLVERIDEESLPTAGYRGFEVRESGVSQASTALVLPDLATCGDCLGEVFDPADRRYRYPFTSCTSCGPRFGIIEALPYDRGRTTMRRFPPCEACRTEYDDPADRRFQHQANACPRCGPQVAFWDAAGRVLATRDDALPAAADALRRGEIVAVKGLGGFHLAVDARDASGVERLRRRKFRPEKPLAVMFPDLAAVERQCVVGDEERVLLRSDQAPIVLLRRREKVDGSERIAPCVSPRNPHLGVVLPYTPLHHLLLAESGIPLVVTSGNRSEEPICTDEREAVERLRGIADTFLVHDRPIARPIDDSVACVALGRPLLLRAARGYAPVAVRLSAASPSRQMALGADQKCTLAVAVGEHVVVSQHLGDLESPAALAGFRRAASDFAGLFGGRPSQVVCDAHPDYRSGRMAEEMAAAPRVVQHHAAHVYACLADNELIPPALGVAWDGTGYGLDGTIWGGEFLHVSESGWRRAGRLRPFRLPGGERAVREPRRAALGLLYELLGDGAFDRLDLPTLAAFDAAELRLLRAALRGGIHCPATSSAGRWFDAAASLCGVRQRATFEGQAAMEFEAAIGDCPTVEAYSVLLGEDGSLDWRPCAARLIEDVAAGLPVGLIAARFHNTLADGIVAVARRVGERRVLLCGGCFQNRALLERAVVRLEQAGFVAYWHRRLPPNDAAISLGQIAAAAWSRA